MCPIFNGCGDTAVWILCIKASQNVWRKTNDVLIAFIGYVIDLNKIAPVQSKCSKIPPSTSMHFSSLLATVHVALLRSSWRSCFMKAALFIMRSTNSSLVFTLLCGLWFSSVPTDKILICTRQLQTAVSLHSLKIGHMFMWTSLLRIVHTATT